MNGVNQPKVIKSEQELSQDGNVVLESGTNEYRVENITSDIVLGWQDDEVDLVVFRCRD